MAATSGTATMSAAKTKTHMISAAEMPYTVVSGGGPSRAWRPRNFEPARPDRAASGRLAQPAKIAIEGMSLRKLPPTGSEQAQGRRSRRRSWFVTPTR